MGLSRSNSAPLSYSFWMHAFFLLWCCGLLVTFVSGGNNETDRLALLEFKAKITSDPFRVMSSWNDSIHFCQWRGITCGHWHQRVTMLDLKSLKLAGSISTYVGHLSFLKNLTLQNNSFHNEIPLEIGRLHWLQVLRLQNNTINGKIPIILASCTNLNFLQVSYNFLTGEIQSNLGTLSNFRFFAIPQNNVTGSIPNSFRNISSLEVFSAFFNQLGGSIPDSFGQLTKITVFNLGSNKLSGTIPPSFFNLSSMIDFNVGGNRIQGHLPLDIGITLPNMYFFSIIENQFTGSIPASITNASNLYLLQLSNNKLHGNVPSLEKLNRMTHFRISNNNLGNGGENDLGFLCSLTNDTYLTSLHINGNKFGEELHKCIGNFSTTLISLFLDDNILSGKIPIEVGNLINLEELYMW